MGMLEKIPSRHKAATAARNNGKAKPPSDNTAVGEVSTHALAAGSLALVTPIVVVFCLIYLVEGGFRGNVVVCVLYDSLLLQ